MEYLLGNWYPNILKYFIVKLPIISLYYYMRSVTILNADWIVPRKDILN
jgi:hypothetical protein